MYHNPPSLFVIEHTKCSANLAHPFFSEKSHFNVNVDIMKHGCIFDDASASPTWTIPGHKNWTKNYPKIATISSLQWVDTLFENPFDHLFKLSERKHENERLRELVRSLTLDTLFLYPASTQTQVRATKSTFLLNALATKAKLSDKTWTCKIDFGKYIFQTENFNLVHIRD